MLIRTRPALVASLSLLLFLASPCVFGFFGLISDKDGDKAARLRIAGLHGDRTQIPAMRDALKKGNHPILRIAALRALARLGAREALPEITALANGEDYEVKSDAAIARARLIAEDSVKTIKNGPARAAAKVARFYQEMGLTPETLAAEVGDYTATEGNPTPNIETLAARELADMAYQSRSADYLALPGIASLPLGRDIPTKLKIQMAAKPSGERIATLIQQLTQSKTSQKSDVCRMQLLLDEGADADQAILDKLKEMTAHQENYSKAGFSNLFRTLGCFGNKEDVSFVAQIAVDPGKSPGSDAAFILGTVQNGWKSQYASEY